MSNDVIVIGAGVIGLAIARDLAADHSVLLLEVGTPGRESSWAAAGMLCPHGEAVHDDALFRLGLRSLGAFRNFAQDLFDETGIDVEYMDQGTLVLASDADGWRDLESRHAWQVSAGLESSLLSSDQVQRLEPDLTLNVEGALFCRADHQVRPRLLLEALRKSCAIRGVELRPGVGVDEVCCDGDQVTGVRSSSVLISTSAVVVAAGAWSGQLKGLLPRVPTVPRKGQILALKTAGRGFRHVIRWRQFYFVPRRDGELVLGATNEDCGFDRSVTVTGVRTLLDAGVQMASGLGKLHLIESWAGLRPEVADGLPVIGQADVRGLCYAFGHYRNGILLAPATARMVGDTLRGQRPDEDALSYSPARFSV